MSEASCIEAISFVCDFESSRKYLALVPHPAKKFEDDAA
jgi:hypothetical protein